MSVKRKQVRLEEKFSIVIEQVSIQNGYINKLVEIINIVTKNQDEMQRELGRIQHQIDELKKELQHAQYTR